jgi:flagellin
MKMFAVLVVGLVLSSLAREVSAAPRDPRPTVGSAAAGVAVVRHEAGIALIQVERGALRAVREHLTSMRALAVTAANTATSSAERARLQQLLVRLVEEIESIALVTEHEGIHPLDGTHAVLLVEHLGGSSLTIRSKLIDATAPSLGIDSIAVTTASGASAGIGLVDAALEAVGIAIRSTGADLERLGAGS